MVWLVALAFLFLAAYPERSVAVSEPQRPLPKRVDCPDKCKDLPLEIALVIDASASIWAQNFTIGLWFVQNFVDKFNIGPDKVRVSAVSYGDRVYTEDAFNLDTYSNKRDLNEAITNIPYRAGTSTETGAAIRYMLNKQLPLARPGVRKVIIVLTDGNSQQPLVTKEEADRAQTAGLEVFAIGVGHEISPGELHNIASDGRHVFVVGTYNLLNDIISRLEYEVCGVPPKPPCQFDPVDIAFVIDSSTSIGQQNFTLGLEFIKEFIEEFEINPSSIRVAAVMFGEGAYADSAIPFDAYNNKKDTIDAILRLEWKHGRRTDTGLGIDYTVQNFLPDVRDHAAHVCIVITDGRSQDSEKTEKSANIARQKGLTMFAVGVGSLGVSINQTELNIIAGDEARVLTVTDYAKLNTIKEDLIHKTCVGIEASLNEMWSVSTHP